MSGPSWAPAGGLRGAKFSVPISFVSEVCYGLFVCLFVCEHVDVCRPGPIICSFKCNPCKSVPNGSCRVMSVGLILGLENHPLAVKKDSLSLPSGKDTQAAGPPRSFPLESGSVTLSFLPPMTLTPAPTTAAKKTTSREMATRCPPQATSPRFILKRTFRSRYCLEDGDPA